MAYKPTYIGFQKIPYLQKPKANSVVVSSIINIKLIGIIVDSLVTLFFAVAKLVHLLSLNKP